MVKELLENSIDAGATRVEIQFRHGGKTFIKVADDGCGMTRQQALTSLEPHATSKIRAPEDLFEITSYGFRGEAVPSIASVSRFVMRTKPEAQVVGTEIDVYAGTVNAVRDCGMASGTEITVENLFCSVPARRKFLKSDNVEASHIIRLCRLYALAEISSKMFELGRVERGGMSVEGAVLRAGESFPTSRNICAFVNGRPVECRAVYSAVKEAYSQFVPKGRFAAAYIFITLDPKTVDVNVHPAKLQVRLKDEFGAGRTRGLPTSGNPIPTLSEVPARFRANRRVLRMCRIRIRRCASPRLFRSPRFPRVPNRNRAGLFPRSARSALRFLPRKRARLSFPGECRSGISPISNPQAIALPMFKSPKSPPFRLQRITQSLGMPHG